MMFSIFNLVIGGGMLIVGIALIFLFTAKKQRVFVGHEEDQVEFLMLGVGMECMGLLVFLLGFVSLIINL